jgi:hypothetical protein
MTPTKSRARGVGSIAATQVVTAFLLVALAGCGTASKLHVPKSLPKPVSSPFAVMRTPASSDDTLPQWVARSLTNGDEPTLSTQDLKGARRVLANQQGWLVPAPEDELCLVRVIQPLASEAGGTHLYPSVKRACANQAETDNGRLVETQSLSTTVAECVPTRVVGIVPNSVSEVTIKGAGGASTRVDVERNAYEDVLINPSSVSFAATEDGHGHRYVVVPLSSVAMASHSERTKTGCMRS